MKINKISLIIFFIIIIGAIVRIIGINFGLPYIYHNDESLVVNYGLAYGKGDFNPHFFKVPPLLSYLLFLAYGCFYFIGRVLGFFSSVDSFGLLFVNNPTAFYIIGRTLIGLIPALLSIYFIYKLAKDLFSQEVGILSALFLSFNFLHVRDSHYIYFDIPLTTAVICFLLLLVKLFNTDRTKFYFYSGLLFGLACSIKYNAVLLIIPFALSVFVNLAILKKSNIKSISTKMLMFFVGAILSLFVTNPYMFLSYAEFSKSLSNMPFYKPAFWFHLKVSIVGSMGIMMLLASVIGLILAILKKNLFSIILALYTLGYYFILTISSQNSPRYIFPILPVLLIFAAYFVSYILSSLNNFKLKIIIMLPIVILLMLDSVIKIGYLDWLLIQKDTRTQAYEWVINNIPSGEKIAIDATGAIFPVLRKSKEQLKLSYDNYINGKFKKPQGAIDYKVKLLLNDPLYEKQSYELYYLKAGLGGKRFISDYPEVDIDYGYLKDNKIKFLIVQNMILYSDRFKPFLNEVQEKAVLLAEFSPYRSNVKRWYSLEETAEPATGFSIKEFKDRERFGSIIRIYQLQK